MPGSKQKMFRAVCRATMLESLLSGAEREAARLPVRDSDEQGAGKARIEQHGGGKKLGKAGSEEPGVAELGQEGSEIPGGIKLCKAGSDKPDRDGPKLCKVVPEPRTLNGIPRWRVGPEP